jgi:hypothetical protein
MGKSLAFSFASTISAILTSFSVMGIFQTLGGFKALRLDKLEANKSSSSSNQAVQRRNRIVAVMRNTFIMTLFLLATDVYTIAAAVQRSSYCWFYR